MQCNATQRNAMPTSASVQRSLHHSLRWDCIFTPSLLSVSARPGPSHLNTTQHNYTLHDITRHITPHHNTSRHAAWRWVFSCFGVSVRSFACLFVRWSLSVSSQSFVLFVSHRVYPLWPWLFLPSVFLFTYVGRATFSFAL